MGTIYDNEETLPKIKNDLQDENDILKNIRDSVYSVEKIDPYTMLGKLNQILKIKKGDKGDTGEQGPQGDTGENGVGIQSITSDEPTQDNGYTITSITFTNTNGNQTTLNVSAKNGENAQVDSELSPTSENPVQNKVIKNALDTKANIYNVYTKTETNNLINDLLLVKNKYYEVGIASPTYAPTSISPTLETGYKFLCWLQPSTVGWVGGCYIEHPYRTNTNIWNFYGVGGGVDCSYLLIKE